MAMIAKTYGNNNGHLMMGWETENGNKTQSIGWQQEISVWTFANFLLLKHQTKRTNKWHELDFWNGMLHWIECEKKIKLNLEIQFRTLPKTITNFDDNWNK